MLLKTNCFSRKDVNRELTVLVIQFHFQKWNAAYTTTLEWFHLSSLSHTDWDRRNHHHCSTVIDRWVTKECRSGKKEREREKERRGKRGRSQGTATLCYGCTCPSTTCSTASQHQQLTQLVPESERQRQGWERLGFISNLQGPTGKKKGERRWDVSWFSQYIVNCHFYTTQRVRADTIFTPTSEQSTAGIINPSWSFQV